MEDYKPKDLSFIPQIRGIAVVGATAKNKYFILRTFNAAFKGKLYAIRRENKRIEELPDIPVYTRLTDIPADEPVDFVFISVPREKVLEIIKDCVAKGVRLVSIFTAGFADEGTEQGRRYQAELISYLSQNPGIRVLGPNGMGIYFPRLGIRWRTSLPHEYGDCGMVAQSGGLANLMIHGLVNEGVPVSKAFSIGNAIDINVLDALNYLKDDTETNFIITYIEGLPPEAGGKLFKILYECRKPVILIKAGRSDQGAKAAMSHTASMAGTYRAWPYAIHQAGGILVRSFEQLLNLAKFIKFIGARPVNKLCMVSLSGGYGVICADVLGDYGIELPAISGRTRDKLNHFFTLPGTSLNNPMDVALLINDSSSVEQILETLLDDPEIEGIIFENSPNNLALPVRPDVDLVTDFINILKKAKKSSPKPIIVIIEDIGFDEIRQRIKRELQGIGIPVYSDITEAAETIEFVNQYVSAAERIHYKKMY